MVKILYIGNSFSVDVLEHSVNIAHDLGIQDIKVGNLFYPACSLRMHLDHALNDAAKYMYYENSGDGWVEKKEVSIGSAIKSDDWNIIGIFPGTGDGSAHSSSDSYAPLSDLVNYVKAIASPDVKLLFNFTWLSEKDDPRKELAVYNGDQELVMSMIADRIREHVISTGEFWRIVPFGAAVQNARKADMLVTRDGYHLSYGMGRYIGALTLIGCITDRDISKAVWMPEDMTEQERDYAIKFAQKALLDPFCFS